MTTFIILATITAVIGLVYLIMWYDERNNNGGGAMT